MAFNSEIFTLTTEMPHATEHAFSIQYRNIRQYLKALHLGQHFSGDNVRVLNLNQCPNMYSASVPSAQ